MRARMKPYLENRTLVYDILINGTCEVKTIADQSMLELRKGLGLMDLKKEILNIESHFNI